MIKIIFKRTHYDFIEIGPEEIDVMETAFDRPTGVCECTGTREVYKCECGCTIYLCGVCGRDMYPILIDMGLVEEPWERSYI